MNEKTYLVPWMAIGSGALNRAVTLCSAEFSSRSPCKPGHFRIFGEGCVKFGSLHESTSYNQVKSGHSTS